MHSNTSTIPSSDTNEALWPQQTDATLALHAAIEGDATLWAAQSLGFLGRARDPEDVLSSAQDEMNSVSDAEPLLRNKQCFRIPTATDLPTLKAEPVWRSHRLQRANPSPGKWKEKRFEPSIYRTMPRSKRMAAGSLHQDTMGEFTISSGYVDSTRLFHNMSGTGGMEIDGSLQTVDRGEKSL